MYVKLYLTNSSASIAAYEPTENITIKARTIGKSILLNFDSFLDFILNKLMSCDIVAFNKDINFFIFLFLSLKYFEKELSYC